MLWSTCFSEESIAYPRKSDGIRSHFQRDFDRLVFSSPFRRLQSKTQVFPLPGSKFVHNRLTHSLEVASVGRSLGAMVGHYIAENLVDSNDVETKDFYKNHLAYVIASACLAHDVGNPAFGHSGEKAISNYFINHANTEIDGRTLRSYFHESEWSDLVNFEGNANALRQLTKQYVGKHEGGLGLTITTLASILKYPCPSTEVNSKDKHRKKYGFFQADKEVFDVITQKLGFIKDPAGQETFKRHPFVYLVEAADDICYSIMDMEDAHRLGILSKEVVSSLFLKLINQVTPDTHLTTVKRYQTIKDDNESISYLRAKLINVLVQSCYTVFIENHEGILNGSYNETLMSSLDGQVPAMQELITLSVEKIYRHPHVLEIEVAGYNLMSELLQLYIPAALSKEKQPQHKTVLRLIPQQFTGDLESDSFYLRAMNVLDHITSMTDIYATEHFRRLKGIDISTLQ